MRTNFPAGEFGAFLRVRGKILSTRELEELHYKNREVGPQFSKVHYKNIYDKSHRLKGLIWLVTCFKIEFLNLTNVVKSLKIFLSFLGKNIWRREDHQRKFIFIPFFPKRFWQFGIYTIYDFVGLDLCQFVLATMHLFYGWNIWKNATKMCGKLCAVKCRRPDQNPRNSDFWEWKILDGNGESYCCVTHGKYSKCSSL